MPTTCFIHIYKCGGTSLREYIKTNLARPESVILDQGAYPYELELHSTDRVLGNLIRSEYLRFIEPNLPRESIILTHSFYYDFMKRWQRSFTTMLRDPVQRAQSQFAFERRDDISKWLETDSNFNFNLQTAALCGVPEININENHLLKAKENLHHFDFVGLVDEYEKSMALFNRIYGISASAPIQRLNTSDYPAFSDRVVSRIKERSEFDLELLAYAKRLITAKQAAFDLIDSGDFQSLPESLRSA